MILGLQDNDWRSLSQKVSMLSTRELDRVCCYMAVYYVKKESAEKRIAVVFLVVKWDLLVKLHVEVMHRCHLSLLSPWGIYQSKKRGTECIFVTGCMMVSSNSGEDSDSGDETWTMSIAPFLDSRKMF